MRPIYWAGGVRGTLAELAGSNALGEDIRDLHDTQAATLFFGSDGADTDSLGEKCGSHGYDTE